MACSSMNSNSINFTKMYFEENVFISLIESANWFISSDSTLVISTACAWNDKQIKLRRKTKSDLLKSYRHGDSDFMVSSKRPRWVIDKSSSFCIKAAKPAMLAKTVAGSFLLSGDIHQYRKYRPLLMHLTLSKKTWSMYLIRNQVSLIAHTGCARPGTNLNHYRAVS